MQDEIHFDEILNKYRSDPYEYMDIKTAHTGRIRFNVEEGTPVEGATGEWKHIPGTLLYELERERNIKPIQSAINGIVATLAKDLDRQFVEAGKTVMTIRHPLKKREIIDKILRTVLSMFYAPERAKYFFALDIQAKMEKYGQKGVSIKPGDEILTMSLMKRDTPVLYEGEPGIIHSVYFSPGDSIDHGAPILGICSEEKMPLVQKIINRVKSEWE